jgi:hypothetical protein
VRSLEVPRKRRLDPIIRSEAPEEVIIAENRIEDYSPLRDRLIGDFREALRLGKSPEVVASTVLKVVEAKHPRLVYRADGQAKMLPVVRKLTPARLWDRLIDQYLASRS